MGGRGTVSGLTPDPEQLNDLIQEARGMGYKTLRYTDSTGRQRDIRVYAQGSGTMSASYNAQVAAHLRLAANVGTNRLQQDLAAKQQSYQRQSLIAQDPVLQSLNPRNSKAAQTRANKLAQEIQDLQTALRIARSNNYPADVF